MDSFFSNMKESLVLLVKAVLIAGSILLVVVLLVAWAQSDYYEARNREEISLQTIADKIRDTPEVVALLNKLDVLSAAERTAWEEAERASEMHDRTVETLKMVEASGDAVMTEQAKAQEAAAWEVYEKAYEMAEAASEKLLDVMGNSYDVYEKAWDTVESKQAISDGAVVAVILLTIFVIVAIWLVVWVQPVIIQNEPAMRTPVQTLMEDLDSACEERNIGTAADTSAVKAAEATIVGGDAWVMAIEAFKVAQGACKKAEAAVFEVWAAEIELVGNELKAKYGREVTFEEVGEATKGRWELVELSSFRDLFVEVVAKCQVAIDTIEEARKDSIEARLAGWNEKTAGKELAAVEEALAASAAAGAGVKLACGNGAGGMEVLKECMRTGVNEARKAIEVCASAIAACEEAKTMWEAADSLGTNAAVAVIDAFEGMSTGSAVTSMAAVKGTPKLDQQETMKTGVAMKWKTLIDAFEEVAIAAGVAANAAWRVEYTVSWAGNWEDIEAKCVAAVETFFEACEAAIEVEEAGGAVSKVEEEAIVRLKIALIATMTAAAVCTKVVYAEHAATQIMKHMWKQRFASWAARQTLAVALIWANGSDARIIKGKIEDSNAVHP